MAATKRNAMLIQEAREKIRTTQLINRLQNHALGDGDMSPTQIKAVEILLRKSVPDLQSVTHNAGEGVAIEAMPIDELFRIAGRGRTRSDPAPTSPGEPTKLH